MATKEKVKKKTKHHAAPKDDERPGSAHSQISVKEAETTKDNTNDNGPEKFIEDENKQEKDEPTTQNDKNKPPDRSLLGTPQKSKGQDGTPIKNRKSEAPKAPKKGKNMAVAPDRSPSPAVSLAPSEGMRRSPSPFNKNLADPRNAEKEMGSAVSIKTTSTVKEAWTDRHETASLDGLDKEDEAAQNAYIPYLYARRCIAKVVDDLSNMKHSHIRIVGDMQNQYKEIEDETQSQFNTFVFCLRQQYSGKVQTFKQVIDIHRVDLQQKEVYWNEMLASLAERNNRLLKDKKILLIHNKVEIERLEKERIEMQTELTQQLDKSNAALVAVERDTGTDELKAVVIQLEAQKTEVTRLQAELSASQSHVGVMPVVMASRESESGNDRKEEVTRTPVPLMAAAVVSDKEKSKMADERGQMDDERQKYDDDRLQMEEERQGFDNQRQEWLDEIKRLQLAVAVNTKDSAEWKAKYTGMKTQLEDSATLHAKYKALEDQYLAIAAIVAASDSSKQLAEENAKKTKDEKNMMVVEQDKLENEIYQWEAEFVQQNGRPATDDDKSDSVKEMYVQKEELVTMVTSLDKKLDTFEQVEKGKIPDPPEVAPVPITIKDPEVQTIEIKVPDPTIVAKLENSYEEIRRLREQISELQQENVNQSSQISQMNEELSKQRERIDELEREVAVLKAAAVGVAAAGANSAELDEMKKENRELKKDIKKMLKKLEKDKGKTDTAVVVAASPEEKISSLEDKITDLESENEGLLEDKAKLTSERNAIMEQMAALQLQLASAETAAHVGAAPAIVPVVAPVPVESSRGQDCSVVGHADLVQQLETKTQEVAEKDMKIQEQEQRISDKIQEIDKDKDELKHMRRDMMKMAREHGKLQIKLKDLVEFERTKKLLAALAKYVHEIHGEVPDAANGVVTRLTVATADVATTRGPYDQSKNAVTAWEEKHKTKTGKEPGVKDRDAEGTKLHAALEEKKEVLDDNKINVEALKIMKTGDYVAPVVHQVSFADDVKAEGAVVEQIEHQMSAMDNKVSDLETENDDLKKERSQMAAKLMDLETKLEEAKNQADLHATLAMGTNTEELSEQITRLQAQNISLDTALLQEKTAHNNTKDELENLHKQMAILREEMANEKTELQARMDSHNKTSKAILKAMEQELDKSKARIDELEKERLANVPLDTAKEITNLQAKITALEKEKSSSGTAAAGLSGQLSELQTKLDSANKNLENQRAASRDLEAKLKSSKIEKDKAVREAVAAQEKKDQARINDDKKRISALEKRIKELESAGLKPGIAVVAGGKGGTSDAVVKTMRDQMAKLKQENYELNQRIKQLEIDLKKGGTAVAGLSAEDKNAQKRNEKILKELEKKYEIEKNKTTKLDDNLKTTEDELKVTKKERDNNANELRKVQGELDILGVAAKQGVEAATKVKDLEKDNKRLGEENTTLTENYNSERVLRRKYYNMVEDMKGKIRVYCRARPLSGTEKERGNVSVLKSPDEFTITVESSRGLKEFGFDQIFMEDSTQETIFEDTNNLIQSALDGYNVCIFAYGQTGSGKTFTMIGDSAGKYLGIAPRAFERIFLLAQELRAKYTVTVTAYMMELYNDKLIDLFAKPGHSDDEKMEIKKDKKGMVYVQGSCVKEAHNSKELYALFDEGSKNRHTASTKMNAESSRSHLVIGVMMESTNKSTGQVLKGKLSLVDLAGSERVAKTGSGAEQLREAMSINKSLSALGDVISALSSDQQFIPYRNNKLTMLMQDSLGGNAKTLMFVNISPADYNQDETIISLMYASRVKLITNDASKNADNKEIAKLKNIIAMLRKGETVEEVE